jgi:hypothetical protein
MIKLRKKERKKERIRKFEAVFQLTWTDWMDEMKKDLWKL